MDEQEATWPDPQPEVGITYRMANGNTCVVTKLLQARTETCPHCGQPWKKEPVAYLRWSGGGRIGALAQCSPEGWGEAIKERLG